MPKEGPGAPEPRAVSILDIARMFPDEDAAGRWFEAVRWPENRPCPRCDDINTYRVKNERTMPYRCRGCWEFFSVRTGTMMECSHIPLRKWAFGMYL